MIKKIYAHSFTTWLTLGLCAIGATGHLVPLNISGGQIVSTQALYKVQTEADGQEILHCHMQRVLRKGLVSLNRAPSGER